jgi:uncharacterized membrane protein YdbT with pleckstrin-like domain
VIQTHRHGIVLLRPLVRSLLIAAAGIACFSLPWREATIPGAALLLLAALLVVVAVARWDRTHLMLRGDELTVVHGVLRRRSVRVKIEPGLPVEVDRSFLGRILGYGTLTTGDLEVDAVPRPLLRAAASRTS